MSDNILRRLLASFKAEHQDHLEKIRGILEDLAKSGKGPGAELEEAFRRAHSLKGAARAVDMRQVETLAHCVETIFSRVREGRLKLDKPVLKTIQLVLDSIEDWVAAYFQNTTPSEPVKALNAVEVVLGTEIKPRPAPRPPGPLDDGPAPASDDELKVSAKSMEQLMAASNRVIAETSRQDVLGKKLRQAEDLAADLEVNVVDRNIRALSKELRDLSLAHSRGLWSLKSAGERLREEILRARMVPAESVFQGLRKMVRDLARDENKEIEFSAEGLGVQADRLVLDAIKDPLMHLLRNSAVHGVEAPAERKRLRKEPSGKLVLRLRAQGNLLLVSVADDGRGVDWKAVAEQAVRRRLLSAEQAQAASQEELSRFLFLPGFSTSRMVTDLAGRGMGLSVVAETVKRLQGRVALVSQENSGMTTELSLPISISSHRLMIMESAGQLFAIPVAALERLVRVPMDGIETIGGKTVATIGDRPVPIAPLAGLIGLGDAPLRIEDESLPVAVLKAPGGSVGVAADSCVMEVEAVVKGIRGGAQTVKTFSGAILAGDGSVVLVLDPGEVIERIKTLEGGSALRVEKPPPSKRVPTILVADDSVTTRTLEKSLLEAHGFQVVLAVDGEEALRLLQSEPVDLAIIDIQMPRMDGFQLIERIKKDNRLSRLPVIIVTSLESREEKERGMAVGADAYIVKRKFDHKGLLETIRQVLS